MRDAFLFSFFLTESKADVSELETKVSEMEGEPVLF